MPPSHKGLQALFTYPLMSAIFDRRTRRVARGTSIVSGPISYTSTNTPAPLTPLEEAVLIVSTELDEVMALSDRILVMFEGRITAQRTPETTTVADLGLCMAGAATDA